MPDEKQPIEYRDAAHVSQLMKSLHSQFENGKEVAGMAMIAMLAGAIAKLADEIETLKAQKP